MSLADDVMAVRTSVTLTDSAQLTCVRIGGRQALDALDRVSPRDLFARPGQMIHTLLLDDEARPIADIYIACDEDDYLILAEGLTGSELVDYIQRHSTGLDISLTDLSRDHACLSLNGPYAWELLATVASPDVIGLPYLGFFHEGRFTCFRAGRTGEYAYDLMIERSQLSTVRAAIVEAGLAFDLRVVGLDALDLCALENGFFNVRHEAPIGITPIELQLQWRLSYQRAFPGSAALLARRSGIKQRTVMIAGAHPIETGAAINLDGERIGSVINAGNSPVRGQWIGVALVDREMSHVGIEFTVNGTTVHSVSSPTVNNRSVYIDPQRHSYVTRQGATFPPLVRP